MPPRQTNRPTANPIARVRIWYACLLVIASVFIVRLFYLQVIRHNYYEQAALRSQLKQYTVEAERGTIVAHNGDTITPIVLNQTLYTLYADPKFVKDPNAEAIALQKVIGGDASKYVGQMKAASRYQILAKKLSRQQKDAVTALKLKGIGAQETNYRTYPQGQLAAQLLGFVNDDGDGQYGLEQALNGPLKGMPGQLKAITDAQGVPLAANKENTVITPVPGKQTLLTIDLGMQQQLEDILKQQVEDTKGSLGSALILDARSGAVKAMANYPTFNPSEFSKVSDQSVFRNAAVTDAFEVGSIMKTLTAAAALDQGVVNKNTTYYDPSHWSVDGFTISNIEEDGGAGTKSIADILQLSLNTGATWLLMQMGGGQINQKARVAWHDYLVNHYQFGKPTGIEQSNEGSGIVPDPNNGYGLNLQYANTAFGQGQTETILQMGAAIASVVNGGTYYQPHLVDAFVRQDGSQDKQPPKVIRQNVVSAGVSSDMRGFMEYTLQKNKLVYGVSSLRPEYAYGGKTGTAQIPKPGGGYLDNRFEGTFLGYIGGDMPQYVIVVRVSQATNIYGYAGAKATAPIYFKLADMLINNFGVQPKTK
ncbi:MAG TPA: penicillin-binding protein 2 [Candidatus Saccharimonadales bacterium]|nr:penicillin-binding protein 2 [Candidatus Saccharimonadales bacterium]